MANIKVSEMTEATVFDDGDFAMIVQGNQNKKISKENMLANVGDISNLETTDKSDVVISINEVNDIATNNAKDNIYSLQETETSKIWIDGKRIYRKVFFVPSLPNAGSLYIDTNISNIDFIFSVYGIASTNVSLNTARPEESTLEISAWYERQTNQIRIVTGNDRTGFSAYVIIEYTKTTD